MARKAAKATKASAAAPTRVSKRKAAETEEESPKEEAKKDGKASDWGFLKAPSEKQLKKPKKAAKAVEEVEFSEITDEDLKEFEASVPEYKQQDDKYKIVAWNVNGIRAVLKKDNYFRAYIAKENPDVLCLSETKIDETTLTSLKQMLPQYPYQYWKSAEQKGYSGTVIFSKIEPIQVDQSIVVDGEEDNEGRFIAVQFDSFWLVHTYVPNSGQKLDRLGYRTEKWDPTLFAKLKELEKTKPVIWCGDLNVAHEEIDIHDPKGNRKSAGFTDAERESFGTLLKDGFVDTFRARNPTAKAYTYFSYRSGAREKNKGVCFQLQDVKVE